MSAEPIKSAAEATGSTNLEKIHDLVQDSQTKCQAFVTSLFSRSANTNTFLDITGTALSAAATVFTPLNTVHALSAGSTVATGSKTSIQNEYLNSVTISHIIQAIQSTYSSDMQKYIKYLDSVSDANGISVVAERSTILSFHGECSLPSADGSIASALQPAVQNPQQSAQLSLTYTIKAADSNATLIASAILEQINSDPAFHAAGVSASESAGGANGTITLLAASSSIVWKHAQFAPAAGKQSALESATFQDGPPTTLNIVVTGAAPQVGDTLTIASSSIQPLSAPPATANQPVAPARLSLTYTVGAADNTPIKIASAILAKINSDANFRDAGVSAAEQVGGPNGTITLAVAGARPYSWAHNAFVKAPGKASAKETATYADGPPTTITITGTHQTGDSLIVEGTPGLAAAAPTPASASVPRSVLLQLQLKPPAAILGRAPAQKN